MFMAGEFQTLDDLYKRVKPALYSKVMELKRKGISYIKEEDVWNYLSENVWKNTESLTLLDMVNDILILSDEEIKSYVLDLLKKLDRNIENEGELL